MAAAAADAAPGEALPCAGACRQLAPREALESSRHTAAREDLELDSGEECGTEHEAAPAIRRRPQFYEILSGGATLAGAAASLGFEVTTIDIRLGPTCDLLKKENQAALLQQVRSGTVAWIHIGTPCTTFCRFFLMFNRRCTRTTSCPLGSTARSKVTPWPRSAVVWHRQRCRRARGGPLRILEDRCCGLSRRCSACCTAEGWTTLS